jgi:hypothetical protein
VSVVALRDVNSDGDFLDFGEVTTYATGLAATATAIVAGDDGLFVLVPSIRTVLRLRDLNLDGDALDFGEAVTYGTISLAANGTPVGLGVDGNGRVLVIDSTGGSLFALQDQNGDGDALDDGEAVVIGDRLAGATGLAVRPDGVILVSTGSAPVTVRILEDRNDDGDFLEFAENISYAEGVAPYAQTVAATVDRAFALNAAAGRVDLLRDVTGDGDALDFGEVTTFASGVDGATAMAAESGSSVLIARPALGGSVYRLVDGNGDGDALDTGEVLLLAEGVGVIGGMALAAADDFPCVAGDLNGDGIVTAGDAGPFAAALVNPGSVENCRADVNGDGVVDGRDVGAFVLLVVGG